jgi:hypothetical protein
LGLYLEKIINLRHPLVCLAAEIDWEFLAGRFGSGPSRRTRAAAVADAIGGRAVDPQTHAQSLRGRAMSARERRLRIRPTHG